MLKVNYYSIVKPVAICHQFQIRVSVGNETKDVRLRTLGMKKWLPARDCTDFAFEILLLSDATYLVKNGSLTKILDFPD